MSATNGHERRETALRPPIFIGGMMKSGTSLLRLLLGKHPSIFASYETHWFGPEMRDAWKDSASPRQKWLRELYEVPDDVFESLKAEASSASDFFTRFMEYCTRRAGKRRWAEKTPDNIRHLDLIWQQWPDALVIHVVRDFRDIFTSWKRNGKATLERFVTVAEATYRALEPWLGQRRANYLEVAYERLVVDPTATMHEVTEFVGEPWADGVDQHDGQSDEYERVAAIVGKKSSTAMSLKRPIFQDSVGAWREHLTASEAAAIRLRLDAVGRVIRVFDEADRRVDRRGR
jgi:hypothetical protein